MHIVLQPMPQSPGAVCVGTADGAPLTYRGRDLYVGDQLVTMAEVGEDLVDAVDRAATRVLGSEWVTSLARLAQVNRRTTSKDRIAKFGLPEYILIFLGRASDHEHARALGHALLCVEAVQSADWITLDSAATGRPLRIDLTERDSAVREAVRKATALVDDILAERQAFRDRKRDEPVTDD